MLPRQGQYVGSNPRQLKFAPSGAKGRYGMPCLGVLHLRMKDKFYHVHEGYGHRGRGGRFIFRARSQGVLHLQMKDKFYHRVEGVGHLGRGGTMFSNSLLRCPTPVDER